MRTTSVNSAVHAGEGCVIAFPRRKTIDITVSAPASSPSEHVTPASRDQGPLSLETPLTPERLSQAAGSDRAGSNRAVRSRTNRAEAVATGQRGADWACLDVRSGASALSSSPLHAQGDEAVRLPVAAGSQMFFPLVAGMAHHEGPVAPGRGLSSGGVAGREAGCPPSLMQAGTVSASLSASPEAVRKAAVARLVSLHDKGQDVSGAPQAAVAPAKQPSPDRPDRPAGVTEVVSGQMDSVQMGSVQLGSVQVASWPCDDTSPSMVQYAETSHYIAQMAQELARMARGSRLDLLAYFLDMAELEALMHSTGGVQRA